MTTSLNIIDLLVLVFPPIFSSVYASEVPVIPYAVTRHTGRTSYRARHPDTRTPVYKNALEALVDDPIRRMNIKRRPNVDQEKRPGRGVHSTGRGDTSRLATAQSEVFSSASMSSRLRLRPH